MLPPLNDAGLLPPGIHQSTLEELRGRFARFQQSDRRPQLWAGFEQFVREAKACGLASVILVNGSFVTSKPDPNDIDVILVVSGHDFARDLSPAEYNVLSARRVRRRHGLDILVASENSEQYHRYLSLFQQLRWKPNQLKGIVRIAI